MKIAGATVRLRKTWIIAIVLLVFGGVGSAHFHEMRLVWNTIDDEAILVGNGQGAFVTGPVECTKGGRVTIRVEVTQGSISGVGSFRAPCTGDEQDWAATVVVQGPGKFEPGPATATAWATVGGRQHVTDEGEWRVDITLVTR